MKAVFDPINNSPEVFLNPGKQGGSGSDSDLSAWEKEEISLGRSKMQEIITKVVEDAAEQSREWTSPYIGDEEELSSDDDVDFEVVGGEADEVVGGDVEDLSK